jgi:hypothetical protein
MTEHRVATFVSFDHLVGERQQVCRTPANTIPKQPFRRAQTPAFCQCVAARFRRSAAASNELVKLIRKLRWMGKGKEAEAAEMQMALRCVSPADTVLAAPHETDFSFFRVRNERRAGAIDGASQSAIIALQHHAAGYVAFGSRLVMF